MPKLARRLGVGTMTLYGYVNGKEDLLRRMATTLVESVRPGTDGTWRAQLSGYFSALRAVAHVHPSLAGLLTADRIGTVILVDDLEALLGGAEEPIDRAEASKAMYAALAYTVGTIAREAVPGDGSGNIAEAETGRSGVSEADEQFEWGLARLLGTPAA
jgi:AcrR family transcriptional regulator